MQEQIKWLTVIMINMTQQLTSKYAYHKTGKIEVNEQGQKCNLVECDYCGRTMKAGGIRSHQFYKHGITT